MVLILTNLKLNIGRRSLEGVWVNYTEGKKLMTTYLAGTNPSVNENEK